MAYDEDWAKTRMLYRRRVAAVFADIASGHVDEEDLQKLNNFCMTSLMLMSKVQEPTWRRAERDAELAGLLNELASEQDVPQ